MDFYKELISVLPLETVEYAFAYGSGALQQKNENKDDKMIDFIVVTNNSVRFHEDNISRNPSHYSFLRVTGPNFVSRLQCGIGARVYYNTHVTVGNRKIKYGVISRENVKEDLLDWRWIYVAGRLHKPVLEVIGPSAEMAGFVMENRRSALHAALLLLPDRFTLSQLFATIVGLSYTGDFRMVVGEDKNKISKIVDGSFDNILKEYEPLMCDDARLSVETNEKVMQDCSTQAINHRLNLLPSEVLNRLQKDWNKKHNRQRDTEEVLFSLAHRHDVGPTVQNVVASIVRPVSYIQTAKNAASAGVTKSIVYSLAKMTKMFKK